MTDDELQGLYRQVAKAQADLLRTMDDYEWLILSPPRPMPGPEWVAKAEMFLKLIRADRLTFLPMVSR